MCNYGWTEGKTAYYPIQQEFLRKADDNTKKRCGRGKSGLIGGLFKDTNLKFGANCYGIRPGPRGEKIKYEVSSPIQSAHKEIISDIQKATKKDQDTVQKYKDMIQMGQIDVQPFNTLKWSEYSTKYSTYHIYPDKYTHIQVEEPSTREPSSLVNEI